MSAKLMGEVFGYELEATTCLVLLAFADHADAYGENVRPSIAYVAWKTGFHERTVQRVVKDLRSRGVLVQTRKSGLHRATTYRVVLSALTRKPPRPSTGGIQSPIERGSTPPMKGDKSTEKGDKGGFMGDKAGPPKPYLEPSTEPGTRNQRFRPASYRRSGWRHIGEIAEEVQENLRGTDPPIPGSTAKEGGRPVG